MYVDPYTRQTFEYANQIPCENNPQNVIALDHDTEQYYVLTSQPVKKGPPHFFEPTQLQTLLAPTPLLSKIFLYFPHLFFPRKNSNIFGFVIFSLNIQMMPPNSLVRL